MKREKIISDYIEKIKKEIRLQEHLVEFLEKSDAEHKEQKISYAMKSIEKLKLELSNLEK